MVDNLRSARHMGVAELASWMLEQKRRALPPWELGNVPPVAGVPQPGATVAARPILTARVDHDRWIVDCPFCNSAELADPDEPFFWCIGCYNAEVRGKWLPVRWPAQRKQIEAALERRKQRETRNWNPGETVIDLLAQTLEREAP